MKTKQEICVPIRNEEELQQAKEILLRNGEKLSKKLFYLSYNCDYDNLYLSKVSLDWCLGSFNKHIEIPLSELESVLKDESECKNTYYSFFKFMSDEHNLTLTDTEMSDIIYEAKKVIEKLNND